MKIILKTAPLNLSFPKYFPFLQELLSDLKAIAFTVPQHTHPTATQKLKVFPCILHIKEKAEQH